MRCVIFTSFNPCRTHFAGGRLKDSLGSWGMRVRSLAIEAPGVAVLPRDSVSLSMSPSSAYSQLLSWWPPLPSCGNSRDYKPASGSRREGVSFWEAQGRRDSCWLPRPRRHRIREKGWTRRLPRSAQKPGPRRREGGIGWRPAALRAREPAWPLDPRMSLRQDPATRAEP